MGTYTVEVTRPVDAAPETVYTVFADYVNHHPKILPKPYFDTLEVLEGGTGAGTVIHVTMKVWGSTTVYRFVVTEPEPGRLLVEEDAEAGVRTTFRIEPLDDGKRSAVTLATESRRKSGFAGTMESMLAPMFMRRMYAQEIDNVNDYLKNNDLKNNLNDNDLKKMA